MLSRFPQKIKFFPSLLHSNLSFFSDVPPQSKSTDQRPKLHNFADSFFSALNSNSKNKRFSTPVLYNGPLNTAFITFSKQTKIFSSVFWIATSYFIYAYVHAYIALLPAFLASGSILSLIMANNYEKRVVKFIKLNLSQKTVEIQVLKGRKKNFTCKIEDVDMTDIVDIGRRKEEETFVVTFDATDIDGNQRKQLRIFIEPGITNIENYDLLKSVLLGNEEEVGTFELDENLKKNKEEEEKALDKKIEEEFERIKKEAEKLNNN